MTSRHRQSPYTLEQISTGLVIVEAESLTILDTIPILDGLILVKHYEPEAVDA